MWELELRNAGKADFYLWQRGTYEECVAEMFSMRERSSIELDGMRLTWSSDELEPEVCRDPSCEVVMDGNHRHPDALNLGPYRSSVRGPDGPQGASLTHLSVDGPQAPTIQHQHVWHEDYGLMMWRCVYSKDCPAKLTWEELHRAGQPATPQLLNEMWEAKLAAHPELGQL